MLRFLWLSKVSILSSGGGLSRHFATCWQFAFGDWRLILFKVPCLTIVWNILDLSCDEWGIFEVLNVNWPSLILDAFREMSRTRTGLYPFSSYYFDLPFGSWRLEYSIFWKTLHLGEVAPSTKYTISFYCVLKGRSSGAFYNCCWTWPIR